MPLIFVTCSCIAITRHCITLYKVRALYKCPYKGLHASKNLISAIPVLTERRRITDRHNLKECQINRNECIIYNYRASFIAYESADFFGERFDHRRGQTSQS